MYPTSSNQKLNLRSSKESELVGIGNLMTTVLWAHLFMEAQGCEVKNNIVYQYNKGTVLMANNGKASSVNRAKHINIRYFFVTDSLAKKEISM